MHEVDHRFTVEGRVCGADGRPVPDAKVIVKDTRVSVGTAIFTDNRGYYKATLHLHNDNRGDPILISALDQEKRVTAQFDAKDVHTERRVTVDIGSGCQAASDEAPRWIYYGAGAGLVGVAAWVSARAIRKRQRVQRRGRGQQK